MRPPVLPANEPERLTQLRALELLDTPAEPVFDHLLRLVARVLDVPVARVFLADRDRLWAKAMIGPGPRQIPRDHSFCEHAIATGTALVVPDARLDERFADLPFVAAEGGIRFYAGMPLKTSAGLVLGTLCVLDYLPRSLSADQHSVLQDAAAVVVEDLQRREAVRILALQSGQVTCSTASSSTPAGSPG